MEGECPFCRLFKERKEIISETQYFFEIRDADPISRGHTLIISKRHVATIFDLGFSDGGDISIAIFFAKLRLDKEFHPDGYNITTNCGKSAGQKIFHAHIHIIPRYEGEMPQWHRSPTV